MVEHFYDNELTFAQTQPVMHIKNTHMKPHAQRHLHSRMHLLFLSSYSTMIEITASNLLFVSSDNEKIIHSLKKRVLKISFPFLTEIKLKRILNYILKLNQHHTIAGIKSALNSFGKITIILTCLRICESDYLS